MKPSHSITPTQRPIRAIPAAEMRAIDRASILESIRVSLTISRSQIAEDLGLSLPTVTRIVDGLVAEGLVIETGIDAGQEQSTAVRKRTLLQFNGAAQSVLGVDLGGTKIYGAVANLNGAILHEINFEHHQARADESLELLCQVLDDLLLFAKTTQLPVLGMGIGVPGVVQPEKGVVSIAPALDWMDFPLEARLALRYPYPILVENDVNLAALGEAWFGVDPDVNNLILLAIGTGIGAGVVLNRSIYSGSHHMAGEVGYFLPRRSCLGQAYPGFGALEQLASGTGIAERGRVALAGLRPPEQIASLTAEHVFSAARRSEPWAEAVLRETVDYLAQLIAAITLIIDPDIILLGGGVAKSADLLIEPIQKRLARAIPLQPKIQASRLGFRASIMGALVQVLHLASDYDSVHNITAQSQRPDHFGC